MSDKTSLMALCLLCAILMPLSIASAEAVVKREQRTTLLSTLDGEISAARVADGVNASYLLHFFTLEPNSLFLPALLHADMVFYVHAGSGELSWTEEDGLKSTYIKRGDVYRLEQGSIFFIQSKLETETQQQKLEIHAIFANSKDDLHEPPTGAYSSIHDLVLGFNRQVLRATFQVPDDVIDELKNGTTPPAIVHGLQRTTEPTEGEAAFETESRLVRSLLLSRSYNISEQNRKKKKKSEAKLFNLFEEDKDVETCNGWSTTVTGKKLSALKGTDIGLFMVNLTAGSMMGPHWNPQATEIAVVLQGRGMIRVVCSSVSDRTHCKNARFEVKQGDVFVVPMFHPTTDISFNNDTLVLVGFSTAAKRNRPQFLAGKDSLLWALDRDVLAVSLNVSTVTVDRMLGLKQQDSVILDCVSCAEEEMRAMEEELEREETKTEEEKGREREEEEGRERGEEGEEAEEEAAGSRREEEAREKQREQEEAGRREEEEREKQREQEERGRGGGGEFDGENVDGGGWRRILKKRVTF